MLTQFRDTVMLIHTVVGPWGSQEEEPDPGFQSHSDGRG